MSVPTYEQFIEAILRFLATKPEGAIARDAHESAAEMLQLTEAQREDLIASGQATYKNRSGWAHDRLKRAGLSSSAKRGYGAPRLSMKGIHELLEYRSSKFRKRPTANPLL